MSTASTKPGPQNAALRDYDSVRRAIAFISEHWRAQPTIEAMADAAAVTPDELHHLFRRWAGLTPKAFMQALTLDHAKGLLRDSASVLDAALDSGLSGPGRLHDLFVTHEAMSPGEWKNGGAGMTLRYGFHPSPFGTAIVIASGRGLAGLAFADPGEEQAALADMQRRWPRATYVEDRDGTAALAQRIFDTKLWRPDQPLRVVLIGTDFEVRVWETLLKIPMGRAVCYSDIATKIKSPKASRAVGAAVGKNPISFVVPCHRALGKSGALTGYHWGITRKQAMLGWEAGPGRAALAPESVGWVYARALAISLLALSIQSLPEQRGVAQPAVGKHRVIRDDAASRSSRRACRGGGRFRRARCRAPGASGHAAVLLLPPAPSAPRRRRGRARSGAPAFS